MSVVVAMAQFAAGADVQENLEAVKSHIREAADLGGDLVVLPENAMFSNPQKANPITPHAETLDGPFMTSVQETARDHDIAVLVGITETVPGEARNANTLVAVDRVGEQLGHYRKVHLYDAFGYQESKTVLPARLETPLTFTLGGITFGAMTCYDIRFPEMARYLLDAGADAFLLPAAWAVGPVKEHHWSTLLHARAIENTAYVIGVGQTGPDCTGQSMAIDPMGTQIANVGEAPGIAVATLDPERLRSVRESNPSIMNRRFAVVER